MSESPETPEQAFLHSLLLSVLDGIFQHVDLKGASAEYGLVWLPQGRAVTQVNVLGSEDFSRDRMAEAFDLAAAQLREHEPSFEP